MGDKMFLIYCIQLLLCPIACLFDYIETLLGIALTMLSIVLISAIALAPFILILFIFKKIWIRL